MRGAIHERRPVVGERGSGTLLVLATGGILFTALGAVGVLAGAVAAQHRVETAAELSALSAAAVIDEAGDPCRVAARVSRAHGVRLATCELSPGAQSAGEASDRHRRTAVRVTVREAIEPLAGHPLTLTATARAGWARSAARAGRPSTDGAS